MPDFSSSSARVAKRNSRSGAPSNLEPTSSRSSLRFLSVNGTAQCYGTSNALRHQKYVKACVQTHSGGLPELDPIALGIGDPAESTDTLHVLRLLSHIRTLGAQLREHRVQVADSEVEHGLLGAGREVVGLGLEGREDRQPGFLTPEAVLISVEAQAVAIPRAQGHR